MYFKKGILESDGMWTTNKKLIETSQKGFRSSIPKNFPYFCAEFGEGGGFGHIIEDTDHFPQNFGLEIACGMLEEPAQIVMRAKRMPAQREKERVADFRAKWNKFDWTRRLKKNNPPKKG